MGALVTAVVLCIALATSGVWRALASLAVPGYGRRPQSSGRRPSRRDSSRRRPSFRRVVPKGRPGRAAPPAHLAAPTSAPPRTPVATTNASERTQLRQLAERLARLESALDIGDVHLSPHALRDATPVGAPTWGVATPPASDPASIESSELSRAERELMQKMRIGQA